MPFSVLSITNPNKAWVCEQIDSLIKEWSEWNKFCLDIEDSQDFDPQTCSEAIKDGYKNIRKHEILREKTLVFLRNHFSGSEFVLENWKSHPHEDSCSWLKSKVPCWIHRLEIIKASMDYILVPESYWKEQGKEFLSVLSKTTAKNAVDVAASYLKTRWVNDVSIHITSKIHADSKKRRSSFLVTMLFASGDFGR